MSSKYLQARLIVWVIATVIVFLFISMIVTPFVDLLAPWMILEPCIDEPPNCEDWATINYAPMNYALLAIAATLVGWGVLSISDAEIDLPDAPEPCDCGNCSECGVLEDYIDDQRY